MVKKKPKNGGQKPKFTAVENVGSAIKKALRRFSSSNDEGKLEIKWIFSVVFLSHSNEIEK